VHRHGRRTKSIDEIWGVSKAYTTRVGAGPFPSELHDEMGDVIRERGGESGTTTGRPRRTGWLDLVALRYAARLNTLTALTITKLYCGPVLRARTAAVRYRLFTVFSAAFRTTFGIAAKSSAAPNFWPALGGLVSQGRRESDSGTHEWLDLLEDGCQAVTFDFDVVAVLEVQPKALSGLEVPREPQGRVGADAPLAMDDLVDAPRWDADRHGKPVLGDLQRLQVLLHQHLSGVDGRHDVVGVQGVLPSRCQW
jgi:hypothetical protein